VKQSPDNRLNGQAIRGVLQVAGVELIDANVGGPGVRLREAKDD